MSTYEAVNLPLTLGQQMASARKRLGLTQTQLGKRWGEHRTTISRWERGDGEPPFSKMVELAAESEWPLRLLVRAVLGPETPPDGPGGQEVAPTIWKDNVRLLRSPRAA